MEFSKEAFAIRLRELMYDFFPYEPDRLKEAKHKKTPLHIRDVAFWHNPLLSVDENTLEFQIGNAFAEEKYPYYHILEDAKVIRKRGRGSEKTRGSQAKVEKLSERDYNRVTWTGKNLTREYSRNIRGKRARIEKISHYVTNYNGEVLFINREANSYLNVHYNYIETMLEDRGILDRLASEFGMKRKRTQQTSLLDDFLMQSNNDPDIVAEVLSHFEN